jgi:primosomal protein N'
MPAPLARAKKMWRYQMMLRCEHAKKITEPIKYVMGRFKCPKTVRYTIDVDAFSLL